MKNKKDSKTSPDNTNSIYSRWKADSDLSTVKITKPTKNNPKKGKK